MTHLNEFDFDSDDALDAFFEDDADALPAPWLADFAAVLAPHVLMNLAITSARGTVEAFYKTLPEISTEQSAVIAAAAGETVIKQFATVNGEMCIVVPAAPAAGSGTLLLFVDETTAATLVTTNVKPLADLAIAHQLALKEQLEAEQRAKQLVAEQRTLDRDHKAILEQNLNEREAAMHEKQALIADLENQVKSRTLQLEAAKQRAESANADKSRFLANMSHEIRTPMTAILGYTDLMLSGEVNGGETESALQTIRRNGDHLLTLINDILDLSKIESGKLPIESLPTPLEPIIQDVIGLLRGRATEKNLRLVAEIDGAIPEQIVTDPTRLRQIVLNIIGNAIKFTESGEVRLKLALDREAPRQPQLVMDVIDTGIGMTPEQVARIFEPFVQADASTTRKFGGTGLGLAISQHLAKQLGGNITATSRVGHGTTFSIRVATGSLQDASMMTSLSTRELQRRTGQSTATTEMKFKRPLRILLAEDGPDNQRLITAILLKMGADVISAENGVIAVEKATQADQQDNAFNVILMDMQMPELDGYGATRQLRDAGYDGPIIALTAHAMVGDRDRCIAAGCDDYLTKPINRKKLFEMVDNTTSGQPSTQAAAAADCS